MSATAEGRPREQRALAVSIVIAMTMGVVAVAWGIVSESRVILFDGVYMLLGIVLSGLSLLAAVAADSAPTPAFPFGKTAAVPMAIGLQGAALVGTILYAVVDAVTLIRGGGADVAPGAVLTYGVLTALVSLWVSFHLPRLSDQDLVRAEAAQWRAGALLSAVIAAGGGAALLLEGTAWSAVVPYADPVLVLVACATIAPVPYGLLRTAGRELLEAAPPAEVQAAISEAVDQARVEFGLPAPTVAATKVGGRLYLEVVFVVDRTWQVSEEDAVRHALIDQLAPLGFDLWANVELTTDAALAE